MGKLATSKYIYDTFSLGTSSSRFPTKSAIVNLGLTVSGSYANNQLVQESDLSISQQTQNITFQLDWSELQYINPEGYQYLVNSGWSYTPEILGIGTQTYNVPHIMIVSYTYISGVRTFLGSAQASPFTNSNSTITFTANVIIDPNNTTYFMFGDLYGNCFEPDYASTNILSLYFNGEWNSQYPASFMGTVVRSKCLKASTPDWRNYCYIASSKNIVNNKIVLNCESRQYVTFYMYADVGDSTAPDLDTCISNSDAQILSYTANWNPIEYGEGWPITSYYRSNKTGLITSGSGITKTIPINTSTVEYLGMDGSYFDIDVSIEVSLLGTTYLKFGNASEICVAYPSIDIINNDNTLAMIYYNTTQNTSFEQPYQRYLQSILPEEITSDIITIYLDIYDTLVY